MEYKIIEEAVRILKDYPHLKYYKAIEKAKEVYKKEPIASKQNRSLEKYI